MKTGQLVGKLQWGQTERVREKDRDAHTHTHRMAISYVYFLKIPF